MSEYLPFYISLKNKECLVVGGGKVAERKIKNIVSSKASITVVAPDVTAYIKRLSENSKVVWINRNFSFDDLDGKFVVFAATDDEQLNEKIALYCEQNGVLVNVAKPGKKGNFIVPSFINRKGFGIAISTMGDFPFFAALVKKDLEKKADIYQKLLTILKPFRACLLTKKERNSYNKLSFELLFNEDVFRSIENGKIEEVKKVAESIFISSKLLKGK